MESRINARGQTTVPAKVRMALGVGPGTQLTWVLTLDGDVFVRVKSSSVRELAGMLESSRHVGIGDMNPWGD
ncbi:AbrB family transcriptional regulator [Burkholderia multivorans]|uniref:Transcriptional regulator, AbrB family n=1 Tax=Burkholderia vietnamiensis (strain G4 / LMG 22486) TaxID=269482 RepID=A4JA89_BURVG|nr:transcriptional regulator, AbrB family [Burkholderia vietnamiensis G4]AOJ91590.1 AbrB family transcriptional regulator [Burkholderia multivorans]PRF91724.1 AbrB family transcriptional regulator [Burkholderia multivorans]PRG60956.1 AbrB family transcriptional regulator [Burkholderia multivorans]